MKMIAIEKGRILVDGRPVKIVSGAMHYFRIPRAYWADRLLKLKEMGLNCVETYVCWNLHEKEEGTFDFSDGLDLDAYLTLAESMGLYCIVRPGPYICSEWDFGGLPWWLLREDMELRSSDPLFLKKITPYLTRVTDILKPHALSAGGGLLFVQVENEYGSYGNDKAYLNYLADLYVSRGLDVPLITSDGDTEFLLTNGTLDGVTASVNYRSDSAAALAALRAFRPEQPGAVMELWNGRAMHWGEKFVRRDVAEVAASVAGAVERADLVNLYMFHGGTTFGFMNGSIYTDAGFACQMTSYDVDAPLDEYGRRTEKYYAEQAVICRARGIPAENTARDAELKIFAPPVYLGAAAPEAWPAELFSVTRTVGLKSMEQLGQGYGYTVYSTEFFVSKKGGKLLLPAVHDVAHIYINGRYTATAYRDREAACDVPVPPGRVRADIWVENLGRINFGPQLKDRKGLIGSLRLLDNEYGVKTVLTGFTCRSSDLSVLPERPGGAPKENEPAFYLYEFTADAPADAVLEFSGFTRGVAFINGFNLGRHWTTENSLNRLFVPAPRMRAGVNRLVVFDVLHKKGEKSVRFVSA